MSYLLLGRCKILTLVAALIITFSLNMAEALAQPNRTRVEKSEATKRQRGPQSAPDRVRRAKKAEKAKRERPDKRRDTSRKESTRKALKELRRQREDAVKRTRRLERYRRVPGSPNRAQRNLYRQRRDAVRTEVPRRVPRDLRSRRDETIGRARRIERQLRDLERRRQRALRPRPDPVIVKRPKSLIVRERRVPDRRGRLRTAKSWRYQARRARYYNRFRNGVSVFFLPPLGIRLASNLYIVDSSRGSYGLYLRTFLAPPVVPLARYYTMEEIITDPWVRAKVRSVNFDSITFAFGSARISEWQLAKLEELSDAILATLDRYPNEVFLIEGHTDAVGPFEANLALSEDRAAAVQAALIEEFGVPVRNLESVGYGEQYLRIDTAGPERRNRRVVIRAVGALMSRR